MSKHEAVSKLKEYNKNGISAYLVSKNEYIDINDSPNSNQYFTKQ
jgi:hypothetical protein